eukprot:COSAG02_NODE_5681_length_4131_cov_3.322669_5_plen_96_part_00
MLEDELEQQGRDLSIRPRDEKSTVVAKSTARSRCNASSCATRNLSQDFEPNNTELQEQGKKRKATTGATGIVDRSCRRARPRVIVSSSEDESGDG